MKFLAIVLAVSLAVAQEGKPAPAGSWNRVMSIAPGADIRVKRQGVKKRISGKLAGASEDAIQINGQAGVTSIPKSDVEQVSVARKRKTRNALLGAAIGGGVGAGVMGGIAAAGQREGADEDWTGIFAVGGLVLGAVIGLPLGLASGSGYAPVYEVARRQ